MPQKGWVTLEISPTSPHPSRNLKRSAGALPARFDRHEGPDLSDPVEHFSTGHQAIPPPCSVGVEGHELDESDHPSRAAGEICEREDLIIIVTTKQYDVDLEWAQARLFGRVHGAKDSRQAPPAANGAEAVGTEGVTADVDAS